MQNLEKLKEEIIKCDIPLRQEKIKSQSYTYMANTSYCKQLHENWKLIRKVTIPNYTTIF